MKSELVDQLERQIKAAESLVTFRKWELSRSSRSGYEADDYVEDRRRLCTLAMGKVTVLRQALMAACLRTGEKSEYLRPRLWKVRV